MPLNTPELPFEYPIQLLPPSGQVPGCHQGKEDSQEIRQARCCPGVSFQVSAAISRTVRIKETAAHRTDAPLHRDLRQGHSQAHIQGHEAAFGSPVS